VDVLPEGSSIAGFCRTANICLNLMFTGHYKRLIIEKAVFPVVNLSGLLFDRFVHGNDRLTANYCAMAVK
jgi:hypothetical protein